MENLIIKESANTKVTIRDLNEVKKIRANKGLEEVGKLKSGLSYVIQGLSMIIF